jgi:hypothetical protein
VRDPVSHVTPPALSILPLSPGSATPEARDSNGGGRVLPLLPHEKRDGGFLAHPKPLLPHEKRDGGFLAHPKPDLMYSLPTSPRKDATAIATHCLFTGCRSLCHPVLIPWSGQTSRDAKRGTNESSDRIRGPGPGGFNIETREASPSVPGGPGVEALAQGDSRAISLPRGNSRGDTSCFRG